VTQVTEFTAKFGLKARQRAIDRTRGLPNFTDGADKDSPFLSAGSLIFSAKGENLRIFEVLSISALQLSPENCA
jgi:hypothetical protein